MDTDQHLYKPSYILQPLPGNMTATQPHNSKNAWLQALQWSILQTGFGALANQVGGIAQIAHMVQGSWAPRQFSGVSSFPVPGKREDAG